MKERKVREKCERERKSKSETSVIFILKLETCFDNMCEGKEKNTIFYAKLLQCS